MNVSSKIQTFSDIGTNWYYGSDEPLKHAIEHAEEVKHKVVVALDRLITDKNGEKNTTKYYGTYKNATKFWNLAKQVDEKNRCFYTIVQEDTECCLYADLEWGLDWKNEDEVLSKFYEVVIDVLQQAGVEVCDEDFLVASASDIATNKGSLHVHCPCVYFKDVLDQQRFFNAVNNVLHVNDDWQFLDTTDKSYIVKTFIDFGVYNKNRQMRLPYCTKMKPKLGYGVRSLKPRDEDNFDISEWMITDISGCDGDAVDVSVYPADITCQKRAVWSKDLIQGILDAGDMKVSISELKGNLITLKNKQKNRVCPINGEDNYGDNAYAVVRGSQLYYRCHDEGCKGQERLLHTLNDGCGEKLLPEPPFRKICDEYKRKDKDEYFWEPCGNGVVPTPAYKAFLKSSVMELNKYCVSIKGVKPYVLYRTEEQTEYGTNVIWHPQMFEAFHQTFQQYRLTGHARRVVLTKLWLEDIDRRCYQKEDCRPYENVLDNPPNVFNTYQGLAISKEQAFTKGKSDCDKILNFIKNSWCRGKEDVYDWVLNWMAHLVQKPWVKMQTSIVLQGTEGTGKGMIVQLLGKIIGENHYFQPSGEDDMFGAFNYLLDNRLLVFGDEMTWGGDKKNAGMLKKLLTEKTRSSNCKYAPQRRVSNMINWIFASNNDWVIPAGMRARRYTVLKVNQDLYTMTRDEKRELWKFCPYSFAKFLYSRDISEFDCNVHVETEGLKEQKIHSMSRVHNHLFNEIENGTLQFGEWIPKQDLYMSFAASGGSGFKVKAKEFWLDFEKIMKLEFKKKKATKLSGAYDRFMCVHIPERDVLIDAFNRLYNCEMINKNVDEIEEDEDEDEGENEEGEKEFNPANVL
jgi:hypothetical protein